MRFRAPIIAAVLLGLALALVWFGRDEPASGVSESAPGPVAAPTVAAGRDAPVGDAAPLSFSPPLHEPAAGAAVDAAPEPPRSPLPGEAVTTPLVQLFEDQRALRGPAPAGIGQEVPRVLPQIAESERAFAAEPIDASWAARAEADMLGKVAQINGLELLDLRVECRSTLCRLQMAQPGGQGTIPSTDVIDAIGLKPHWVLSLAGRAGSLNTVAYLWREGLAPARPAQQEEPSDEN